MTTATLLCSCDDRTGIVAALSDFVFRYNGNILDADQHSDEESQQFFMRLAWSLENFSLDRDGIHDAIAVLAKGFGDMHWELTFDDDRPRVAVFASKTPHCLYDLLLRQQMDELAGDIVCVIANHPDLQEVCTHFDLPFHHIPVTSETKAEAENKAQAILEEQGVSTIVLARYMQILSPEFCARWSGQIINIHHSFLPAFVGAKPYHQAKQRGVKVIGATAHYVTADLDQGPIIEQDVARVSHRDSVADLIRKGRDMERQVLGRAVRYHLKRRVLIDGNRTIVFQ